MKTIRLIALAAALAWPAHALVVSYTYDAAGRLTSANYGGVSSTAYTYDANGNLLSRVNSESLFIPLAGNYTGLIAANPISNAGAGSVTLSVTLTGSFSGKIVLGGKTFKIKGSFDQNGDAALDLELVPAVRVTLHLDPAMHEITGTLTGGVTASLTAFAAPFGKKSPAPGGVVGTFTTLLSPTELVTTKPKGKGFGTVKITTAGSVKLAGTLADGTKISQGTTLVSETRWPLYVPLYKSAGFVGGLVDYRPTPGLSDFEALLDWSKPDTATALYPAAFTTELSLSAALYSPPAKGQRVLDLPDAPLNCDFIAGAAFSRTVTLDSKNVVVVPEPNPEKLTIKLGVKAGTLTGSLLLDGKTRKFSGILQREQNIGAGFFFSDTESLPIFLGDD